MPFISMVFTIVLFISVNLYLISANCAPFPAAPWSGPSCLRADRPATSASLHFIKEATLGIDGSEQIGTN